jgi:hypothetical protein
LTLEQRKIALLKLNILLKNPDEELKQLIQNAHYSNGWFTAIETANAIKGISLMMDEKDLDIWLSTVSADKPASGSKIVGLVLAGNIPLVGFHDVLSVLVSGHIALIKSSSQDKLLLPYILNKLIEIEPEFSNQVKFTDRLGGFDAVIATGSTNTSRYFDYYFAKVPNIIRKSRNSIAVLRGDESVNDLFLLGKDIFSYYGLGCRNVSKIFVPKGYDFRVFFESIEVYNTVANHHKYCNNYDYNKSIYLINKDKHFDNNFLLVKQDERLASPLAVLYYEEYDHISTVENKIKLDTEQIQCIVSKHHLKVDNQVVGFGESQQPKLWDYADGVNTLEFLLSL